MTKNGTAAGVQYYSVMYFIDKSFVSMPSTCGGSPAAKPVVSTYDECANHCDQAKECVGFSHFPHTTLAGKGLCFTFTKMTSTTYYTGCGAGFLQTARAAADTKCMVKLSFF